jgi:hypothetical protein
MSLYTNVQTCSNCAVNYCLLFIWLWYFSWSLIHITFHFSVCLLKLSKLTLECTPFPTTINLVQFCIIQNLKLSLVKLISMPTWIIEHAVVECTPFPTTINLVQFCIIQNLKLSLVKLISMPTWIIEHAVVWYCGEQLLNHCYLSKYK